MAKKNNPFYNALNGYNTLAYMGVNPSTPSIMLVNENAPISGVSGDVAPIGSWWVMNQAEQLWFLIDNDLPNGPTWIQLWPGGGGGASAFPTNSGTANQSGGVLNVLGSNLLNTSGSGNTVTVALDLALDGQIPIGSSAGATVMNTITAGSGITVTNGHNIITIAASGGGASGKSVMGATSIFNNSASIDYATVFKSGGAVNTKAGTQFTMPCAGTISNLYINVSVNTSTSNDTVTVNKNGVNTAIVATITSATTGVYSDLTHSVVFAVGDTIQFELSQALANSWLGNISIQFLAS